MTSLPSRSALVPVTPSILSYYKTRAGNRAPLHELRGGKMAPDAAHALFLLHARVSELGGTLLITDAYRSADSQRKARQKYQNWLTAGKPARSSEAYDKQTMKSSFISRAGRSFHNAGRAVDIAHMLAAPDDVPKKEKLDWLWDAAIPLGWRPIIKSPREGQREAWHFDFMGPWLPVYERLGYAQAAMCAVLDLGLGKDLYDRPWERWVQAQIQRAGEDIGDVDGWFGKMTKAGAENLGIGHLFYARDERHGSFLPVERVALEKALVALPDAATPLTLV